MTARLALGEQVYADQEDVMPNLTRIAPELPVSDLKASILYYQQKLGFVLAAEMPNHQYAIVERDRVAIHLFEHAAASVCPVGIHIFSSDLDDLHAELQRRGARMTQDIVRQPWGNRDFRVKDDAGNDLKFTEPRAEDD